MKNQSVANKRQERPIRILEAAGYLMTRYGYNKTTMEDIACAARISKGALYLEWSSREDLFDALFDYEMKKLLLDLRSRVEKDPLNGGVAALYGHTLLAMQNSPLIGALYTRDGRVLGDFIHRQNPERYTDRLLMSKESVMGMQAAGLLRSDIAPEVMTYLFSIMAVGLLSISSIIPAEKAPSLGESVAAISAMVQSGLALPDGDPATLKESTLKMVDYMSMQYENKGKNG